jgi:16S rRNA (cytidine1402-2'-O)-methyltransferase
MPLIIVATPLGNLNDVPPRVIDALTSADVVAAEDTRVTRRLCSALGLPTPAMVSYRAQDEAQRAEPLADRVAAGETVVLVSDAGLPAISDPGAALVALCHARGLPVTLAPGPSAVGTALAASGFPAVPFHFLGFPPRKGGPLRRWLTAAGALEGTLVLYESPHRTAALVAAAAEFLPGREGCLCRELTKRHEELLRLPLPELAAVLAARGGLKGEVALVIGPGSAPQVETVPLPDGAGLKPIAAALATRWGVSKREAYQRLLALEQELSES